jgi:hypothetical protein
VVAEARLAPPGKRSVPTVAWRCEPSTGRGLSLPHLIGGESALRQTWVAKADLNFDHAVATNARTHGKRQAMEGELEIGDLQSLRSDIDLAIRSEPRGLKIDAESDLGLGRERRERELECETFEPLFDERANLIRGGKSLT